MEPKTIFIVGASSGIGFETAKILSENGHRVIAGSRNGQPLQKLSGVEFIPLDVTSPEMDLDALPDSLQGLIYCPGTIRLMPIQRLAEKDFQDDFRINLLGAVKMIQASLPRLKKSPGGGAIVLFSTVAVQTGMPFHASIAAAKGAVEGLTRALAAELAPRVRVNAVAPSLTDTPLGADLLSSDEKRKAAAERHPLKRIGSAAELARLSAFLVSDDASWMTGQILHVDGGMSSLRTFR